MNGMEVLKKIKEIPGLKDVPVIMQTAAAERNQISQGIEAGVARYLTKPYEGLELVTIVNDALKLPQM
jgi:CheY-like chemotaxis protein